MSTPAPYDDDDDYQPDPWEIGVDDQCSCELYLMGCDASEPWCLRHDEYRDAVARYEEARLASSTPSPAKREGGQTNG